MLPDDIQKAHVFKLYFISTLVTYIFTFKVYKFNKKDLFGYKIKSTEINFGYLKN